LDESIDRCSVRFRPCPADAELAIVEGYKEVSADTFVQLFFLRPSGVIASEGSPTDGRVLYLPRLAQSGVTSERS
jgi:hypothetical protein